MTPGYVPPGWYNDPAGPGAARYWDGHRWTDHRQPHPPNPYAAGTPGWPAPAWSGYTAPAAPRPRRRVRRIALAVTGIVAVVGIGSYLLGDTNTHNKWYQKGYDIGYNTKKSVVYTDAETACRWRTLTAVDPGENKYQTRMRQVEKGCIDGFNDRNGTST